MQCAACKRLHLPKSWGPLPTTASTADMLRKEASWLPELLGAGWLSLPGFLCLSALLPSASAPAQDQKDEVKGTLLQRQAADAPDIVTLPPVRAHHC